MRISDTEVKKLLSHQVVVDPIVEFEVEIDETTRLADAQLAKKVTAEVMAMDDREDMIADLKARIEAGTYNPTGDDIADTMIRRAIADRIR